MLTTDSGITYRPSKEGVPNRAVMPSIAARAITKILLIVTFIYFVFPIYWLLISATKDRSELASGGVLGSLWFAVPLNELPASIVRSYNNLQGTYVADGMFWRWVSNSLLYSTSSAVIGTLVSVMAGYALAKFKFPGMNATLGVVMAGMLMPAALLSIPMYVLFSGMGLSHTIWAIIVPCCVSPFGLFLGRVYAQTSVPTELIEAARIDGAGEFRIFFTMVLRLLAPAMVTIFLFIFVNTWNNFLLPLVMFGSNKSTIGLRPVTLGLYTVITRHNPIPDQGAVMMGALFGVLPLIILFLGLQKYWQSGLAAGSVKG
ncbi:MAG: carbohydrate ABC transporter permease [Varibaculum sp.]|nr:carbohydrate ABC transporter permease [Varibaculum sp.]